MGHWDAHLPKSWNGNLANALNVSPVWTFALAANADHQSRKEGIEVTGHWRWRPRSEVAQAYPAMIADRS